MIQILSRERNLAIFYTNLAGREHKIKIIRFYRTHMHMGSDHWVALSVCLYVYLWLKPCEDLVKSVNVVNVVNVVNLVNVVKLMTLVAEDHN